MHDHRARRARRLATVAIGLLALAATACEPTKAEPPATTVPAAPTVAKAICPPAAGSTTSAGSITVSTTIVVDVRDLLAAAKADGVALCGGGYRTAAGQIAVRKANCGTSYYDIWEKPSSQCTPPTAIPGTSMHEKGLAVDFNVCTTRTTACYRWLAANAADFGLQNLPSEPWHWSTNGR